MPTSEPPRTHCSGRRARQTRGLLTTEEAAEALGIGSINIVKRWVKIGYIHGVERDGHTLIPLPEIERIRDRPSSTGRASPCIPRTSSPSHPPLAPSIFCLLCLLVRYML